MAKAKRTIKKGSKKKEKEGRPTNYRKEYAEQAYKMCLLGHTDAELANFFEVTEQTINNWKRAHPEFFESVKKGKAIADAEVADRLFQRAMGFEHDSEEIKVMYDKDTSQQEIVRVPVRKVYPPDTTAAIFWLKNRQKEKWREKTETENKNTNTNYNSEPLTSEQIKEINKALENDY
jgi:transcriptional regulator with XRE-family HTH domain